MDTHRFDEITHLTAGTSRRGVVGSVLGGLAALITGMAILEAKSGGNGKGQTKTPGSGKEKTKTPGSGKEKTAKVKGKVWLCHKPVLPVTSPTTGLVIANRHQGTVIQVSASAKGGPNRKGNNLRGHLGHGDVECEVLPTVAIPGQSQAFVKGSACFVEDQAITNAAGIVETTRSVTCATSALPLTTSTDPASSSS